MGEHDRVMGYGYEDLPDELFGIEPATELEKGMKTEPLSNGRRDLQEPEPVKRGPGRPKNNPGQVSPEVSAAEAQAAAIAAVSLGGVKPPYVTITDKGQVSIDEMVYIQDLLSRHPMYSYLGALYDLDGAVPAGEVEKQILVEIGRYLRKDLNRHTESIYKALKKLCSRAEPIIDREHIHFANGTYDIKTGMFSGVKTFCSNRLKVEYNPLAPAPAKFLKAINELLYDDDVNVVQAYFGYCFTVLTDAEKMLLLRGPGGEGKTSIIIPLTYILGDANWLPVSMQSLTEDKFSVANLSMRLLGFAEELDAAALEKTSTLKAIISSKTKQAVRVMRQQSQEAIIYSKLIACTNHMSMASIYDRTDGFWRRQIIVQVRERPKGWEGDARFLDDILKNELPGIALWCLQGLRLLINHNWDFDKLLSDRSREIQEEARLENNSVIGFLDSSWVAYHANARVATVDLYDDYVDWCRINAYPTLKQQSFIQEVQVHGRTRGVKKEGETKNRQHQRARCFSGIMARDADRRDEKLLSDELPMSERDRYYRDLEQIRGYLAIKGYDELAAFAAAVQHKLNEIENVAGRNIFLEKAGNQ